MPVVTFKVGLKMATEETYSVAPGGSTNAEWNKGGRWFDVVAQDLPSLQDRMAQIFPSGHAGRRAMNQRAPVQGRRWSDGGFGFDVTGDILGLMLYGVMGSLSSTMTPGTSFALLAASEITPGGQLMTLTTQPSNGGAILRFVIEGASVGGTIAVSGIDAEGNGASEVISFSSAGSMYTRTSFSSVGGFGLSHNNNGASVSVYGIQYWTHTITANNASNPTFSIERHGDPTAGAASKSFMHTGMLVQSISLQNPAGQRDGVFSGTVTMEGNPTATCTATSLNSLSMIRIWPAWTQAVNKNGSSWYKVTNFALDINGGNRNYRAAAGVQNPQGAFFGAQEVTGSFDIQVSDEIEYNEWLGSSKIELVSTWVSPWKLTSSQNQSFVASATVYLVEPSFTDNDGEYIMSSQFRSVDDATNGIIRFTLINGVPGAAYGY